MHVVFGLDSWFYDFIDIYTFDIHSNFIIPNFEQKFFVILPANRVF